MDLGTELTMQSMRADADARENQMKCEAKPPDGQEEEQSPFWRENISDISYTRHVQKIAGYCMCSRTLSPPPHAY